MIRRHFLPAFLILGLSAWTAQAGSAGHVLTVREARDLHTLMAEQPDIAFGDLRDGCSARAQLMIRKMQTLGIQAGKVWAFPRSKGENLQLATPLVPGGHVQWCYHVAPVVRVRSGHHDIDMVIDPALFHHPVTVAQWAQIQKTTAGHVPFISRTAFGERPMLPKGTRAQGNYTPKGDPPNPDADARHTMAVYQQRQSVQCSPGAVYVSIPGGSAVGRTH